MPKIDNERIKCPNIILCEGKDEWSFLISYLEYLIKENEVFNTVQVIDFGGITDLNTQLRQVTKLPDFSMVQSILIIRDAEKDSDAAKKSICSTLRRNGFQVPSTPGSVINGKDEVYIAYMLFPSCDEEGDENGTLEDLCLKIVSEPMHEEIMSEIADYLETLKNKLSLTFPRVHKNELHLLISSYDKFVGAKVGEAGRIGLYDWDSVHLKKLKALILQLCTIPRNENIIGI